MALIIPVCFFKYDGSYDPQVHDHVLSSQYCMYIK